PRRRPPPYPARARRRRHARGDRRDASARQHAGPAQHGPVRANSPRGTRGRRAQHPPRYPQQTITPQGTQMNFLDDALLPENQEKLVITVAPYGPEWEPADYPEDIPVTMEEHVQKAVDCYNAGATVLHVHVREEDGKGSKRLSKFNELLAALRVAVPDMILQVGGSISFSPEGEGAAAKWLGDGRPP